MKRALSGIGRFGLVIVLQTKMHVDVTGHDNARREAKQKKTT